MSQAHIAGSYSAETSESEGVLSARLAGPGRNGLQALFAPGANLVLHSLTRGGRELLVLNDGVRAYAEEGRMMGVPLLYPWANRLSAFGYFAGGKHVVLDAGGSVVNTDDKGLPIHGVRPRLMQWEVVRMEADASSARMHATLEWEPGHPAFAAFPFRHRVHYRARLTARALEVAVTVQPAAGQRVPVTFGFHPYLRIPGGPRARAELSVPARRLLEHDERMIPTGASQPFEPGIRRLSAAHWDDGFAELTKPTQFVLTGGDAELALSFLRGYGFAQVFAPGGSDFVCFEPMTARTDALVGGSAGVAMGQGYEAAFEIAVHA
jgi:aldose 1-epimerase